MRGRVVLGALLALSAALPIALTASPASAAGCTASVSDAHPQQNETITISLVGPASTSATIIAHFQSADTSTTVTTDANGHGSTGLDIGGAAYGESVVVDITAGTASCSVTFTPTAAASTTTTTTTTAAPTTTVAPATATLAPTTTSIAAVRTGTVGTAGATNPSTLPFTGNATLVEAGAGAAFLAFGVFFLGSARRREVLVRLVWPDER